MKLYKIKFWTSILILCLWSVIGCKKEFLSKKPNTSIVVPSTLSDMTQLLDNNDIIFSSPALGFLSGDEYYFPSVNEYNSLFSHTEKNCYTWNSDIYQGESRIADWNAPYKNIFTTNAILDEWEKLPTSEKNSTQGKYVKAWALFCRSYAFYNLVQTFSPAYNKLTAKIDLGIPLKLSANINNIVPRSSVQDTYDRIISDLESSLILYSNSFPTKNLNRPSKAALFGLLARIYLNMGEYDKALENAENCLLLSNKLIDYNLLDKEAISPFDIFNDETIFYDGTNTTTYSVVVGYGSTTINPILVNLYEVNDLRKDIFFQNNNGSITMKFGLIGDRANLPFTGLATDEIYLIKAECLARNGNLNGANSVLNNLLEKRYLTDTYVPFHSSNQYDVLQKVLLERRKELVWRGQRWYDLKRLNLQGANITLTHVLGDKTYSLSPNDPKYVMPIPDDEIALSHIAQNIR